LTSASRETALYYWANMKPYKNRPTTISGPKHSVFSFVKISFISEMKYVDGRTDFADWISFAIICAAIAHYF